ncbi:MspA family porin [Mycobacteriaceae bacterium NPDC060252]
MNTGVIAHPWRLAVTRKPLAVLAALASVASAATPLALADPQVMPDKEQQVVTATGWIVNVLTTNEIIDHIDNLAGASNSWQARVTLTSEARISGQGNSPIQDAQLETGYFVGCRTDSSPGVELGGGIGGTAGGVGGGGWGSAFGYGDVQGSLGGSIRVLLKPGGLTQIPLDRINFRERSAISEITNVNIEADGCGGQVKIQSYATVKIRTDRGNNTQVIYGEPKDL